MSSCDVFLSFENYASALRISNFFYSGNNSNMIKLVCRTYAWKSFEKTTKRAEVNRPLQRIPHKTTPSISVCGFLLFLACLFLSSRKRSIRRQFSFEMQ